MNGDKPGICNVANNRTLYAVLRPFSLAHNPAKQRHDDELNINLNGLFGLSSDAL